MSNYFEKMGSVWYKLNNGDTVYMNDISKFVAFTNTWAKNTNAQLTYRINDGEFPHQLSLRLYGSLDYWWTILLANNIYDFNNQWPRSTAQVDAYIAWKYPDNLPSDAHHYMTPNGLVADLLTYYVLYGATTDAQAIQIGNLIPVSIYDYEHNLNDLKREIVLIDPDYIQAVQAEYETLMEQQ